MLAENDDCACALLNADEMTAKQLANSRGLIATDRNDNTGETIAAKMKIAENGSCFKMVEQIIIEQIIVLSYTYEYFSFQSETMMCHVLCQVLLKRQPTKWPRVVQLPLNGTTILLNQILRK